MLCSVHICNALAPMHIAWVQFHLITLFFFLSYFCALQTIQTSKKDLEKHLQANSLKYMIKCSPEIGKKGSSDEIRAKYGILILSSFSTRQASA